MKTPPSTAEVNAFGAKSPHDWYLSLLTASTNQTFVVDGQVFSGVHDRLVQAAPAFAALDEQYTDLRAFWAAAHIDVQTASSLTQFQSGLRAAHDFINQVGLFAPSASGKSLGLDFNLPNEQGTGTAPNPANYQPDNAMKIGAPCKRWSPTPGYEKTSGPLSLPAAWEQQGADVDDRQSECALGYIIGATQYGQGNPPSKDDVQAALSGCESFTESIFSGCGILTPSDSTF